MMKSPSSPPGHRHTETSTREIVHLIEVAAAPCGFDLVGPVQVGHYNDAVESVYALPDFGQRERLAVAIGNTRKLWTPFVSALRARPELLADADPLERYTVESLLPVLQSLGCRFEVRWAHEAPPRRVAMQRLADVAGLAWLSPGCLSVHPLCGPWIGLRAAVVFDLPGPAASAQMERPCFECEHACRPTFEQAMRTGERALAPSNHTWRQWLAVRDACPLGRTFRYPDEQIEYHYRKDRRILMRAAERRD